MLILWDPAWTERMRCLFELAGWETALNHHIRLFQLPFSLLPP